MNESILAVIVGGIIGTIFIVLPAFIIRAVYRKVRAGKEKSTLENQVGERLEKPPKPANSRRATIVFIGWCLAVIVYGLFTGFAIGVVSNLIYIVFVFPLALGINNGKMIADLIQKAKIRKTSQLVILSILSAVAIYGALHYARYIGFQVRASLEISSGLSEALEGEHLSAAKIIVDYALKEETGHSGFLGYMLYRASEGVSIGRLTRSSALNLGPILTWLYWSLEFGIILGLTIQKGWKRTSASLCESCGNWYGKEKHLGGTTFANESFLQDLIQQKDFTGLGRLIEKNAELPSLEVYFQGCAVCGNSPSQLVVRRAFQNTKGMLQFSDASQTILQPPESSLLLSQLSFGCD